MVKIGAQRFRQVRERRSGKAMGWKLKGKNVTGKKRKMDDIPEWMSSMKRLTVQFCIQRDVGVQQTTDRAGLFGFFSALAEFLLVDTWHFSDQLQL